MGGYVANDAVASATRSPLLLKRHSMLTWTEKGERLDGEMHSINQFSDAYTRQVEALTQKSPFRRFIQSTHITTRFPAHRMNQCSPTKQNDLRKDIRAVLPMGCQFTRC